jgi:hypothetical protein
MLSALETIASGTNEAASIFRVVVASREITIRATMLTLMGSGQAVGHFVDLGLLIWHRDLV